MTEAINYNTQGSDDASFRVLHKSLRPWACRSHHGFMASTDSHASAYMGEDMFSKKPSRLQSHIGSLIGVGTQINGNVTFVGGLRIDGEVTGDVSTRSAERGTLVLGEQARIEGKLTASHLLINGTVIGPTISTEFVELQPRARITGNIYYKGIAMSAGAVVDGQLVHCKSDKNSGELELIYDRTNSQGVASSADQRKWRQASPSH